MQAIGKYIPLEQETIQSIQSAAAQRFQTLKPWSEFLDRTRFSVPKSYNEFMVRARLNWNHFNANYLLIALITIAWSLISNLLLLFDVLFIAVGSRYVSTISPNQPEHLFGNQSFPLITQTQGWLALALVGAILLYLTAAGSTIFWIVFWTALIVFGHAGMMEAPLEADFAEQV
ncbi:prenylated rab acceptor PRA1 [Chytriomyces sp. MP71]|nr:prenylated rab acceptor PRA1 [Chytriomyces sp. MP71]